MTDPQHANAPAADRGEAKDHQGAGSTAILCQPAHSRATDTLPALTGYAVLVEVPSAPEPRYRRRLFLSLHSAQRALERAGVRGLDAHLVLLRLEPVGGGHDG